MAKIRQAKGTDHFGVLERFRVGTQQARTQVFKCI